MRAIGPALLFLLTLLPGTVRAQTSLSANSYRCVANVGPAPQVPAGLPPGAEVSACRDAEKHIHFFLRTPRPNRDGVCRVYEEEIFPGGIADRAFIPMDYGTSIHALEGWTQRPPEAWRDDGYTPVRESFALVTDGVCPAMSDTRYLPTTNVSNGMLKGLYRAWHAATSSSQAFDKAFAGLAMNAGFSPEFFGHFRAGVLRGQVKPEDIRCDDDGCAVWMGPVFIQFDLVDGRFAFTGLQSAPVP
jgi:hypothetical protein